MQFLFNGEAACGDKGVYATFVESADKIKRDMLKFNWDLARAENEEKLSVFDLIESASEKSVSANLDIIMSAVKALQAKRLVIDSLTSMTAYIRTKEEARSFVSIMKKIFRREPAAPPCCEVEIPWRQK